MVADIKNVFAAEFAVDCFLVSSKILGRRKPLFSHGARFVDALVWFGR
jgi:hypothetical protein